MSVIQREVDEDLAEMLGNSPEQWQQELRAIRKLDALAKRSEPRGS